MFRSVRVGKIVRVNIVAFGIFTRKEAIHSVEPIAHISLILIVDTDYCL